MNFWRSLFGGKRVSLGQTSTQDRWVSVEGNEYLNGKHGVRLQGLNDWIVQPIKSEFKANGGFLALESPNRAIVITMASGPLPTLVNAAGATGSRASFVRGWENHWMTRLTRESAASHADPPARVALEQIDGEKEVLRLEYQHGAYRVGKALAMHQGDEYELSYKAESSAAATLESVIDNWKWFMRLRAGETGLSYRQTTFTSIVARQQKEPASSQALTSTIDRGRHVYLQYLFAVPLSLPGWTLTELLREDFRGKLLISFLTASGDILEVNVTNFLASGQRDLGDKNVRKGKLQKLIETESSHSHDFPDVAIDSTSTFAGQSNCLQCKWQTGTQCRGLVSLVHDDFCYDITWKCSPAVLDQVQQLLTGFECISLQDAEALSQTPKYMR